MLGVDLSRQRKAGQLQKGNTEMNSHAFYYIIHFHNFFPVLEIPDFPRLRESRKEASVIWMAFWSFSCSLIQ